MCKRLVDNRLRSICTRTGVRRAFSLTELIVAIGILALMFTLAGQVFNLTVESTGQARAVTQTSQILRAVEETIREDLRHVQPGRSLILIQGNPVNAYWTQQGRESDDDGDPSTGYPHSSDPTREDADGNLVQPRADILMFFTARKGVSYTNPRVTSNLQQVVYGHTNLGEYVPTNLDPPDDYEFQQGQEAFPVDSKTGYPSLDEVSPVPAERWHLARRSVLLISSPTPGFGVHPSKMTPPEYFDLLRGVVDVTGWFSLDEWVVPGLDSTADWFLPEILDPDKIRSGQPVPYERSQLDPTPPAQLADRLGHYFLPDCASFKVEWTLDSRSEFVAGRLNGERDVYWFDPGRLDPDDPTNEHPLSELQAARDRVAIARESETDPDLRDRLDAQFRRLDDLLEGDTSHPDGMLPYSLSDRFRGTSYDREAWDEVAYELFEVRRPNLVVFGAARRNVDTGEIVPEDVFPRALRITIDVFDSERRLDRPIRHVIVAPVGE